MLSTYITKLQTAGQPVDAWAWALYRLDLASAGCFEMGEPQLAYIAQSAQDAFRLEQMLGAAQQAAGRAAAAAIAAQSWRRQRRGSTAAGNLTAIAATTPRTA